MAEVTSAQVWDLLRRQVFAVVGLVNARGEGRTVGVVPVVHDGEIWFLTRAGEPKVRHARRNPGVSVTVPVQRSVPLMPWVKVPAATVTFSGTASVVERADVPPAVWQLLTRGQDVGPEPVVGVRVVPQGDFVTYGVGVSLLGMRDPARARGRAPVR